MTSDHHAPYVQGFTHATMAGTAGCDRATWSRSLKAGLSSDWSLQPGSMKSESLVIADQHCRGECVPGSCTHRPSSHESRQHPKCVAQPAYAGGSALRWGRRLGLSRNKVAVPEGAAGSPPFYGEFFRRPFGRLGVEAFGSGWHGRRSRVLFPSCGGIRPGGSLVPGGSGAAWRGGCLRTGEWTRAAIHRSCISAGPGDRVRRERILLDRFVIISVLICCLGLLFVVSRRA